MRNSAVHPALSRETATSHTPFQFSFKSSTPENCASHIAPFGFVPNTKALRRSSKLSIRRRTLSSLERSTASTRSEEHTSELQSLAYLVCRLLLEKKKKTH